MQSKAIQWIAGTAILVVAILAGGWFLLVSGVYAEADETHAEREQVEQGNESLRLKNAALKAQFEQLDVLRAELAELQVGIPGTVELDALIDQLNAIAEKHEVIITSAQLSDPVEVGTSLTTVLAELQEEPEEDEASSSEDSEAEGAAEPEGDKATPSPSPDPKGTLVEAIDGLYSMPLILSVQGSYANARAFLDDAQRGIERLYLAQTIAVTSLVESEGGSGLPPNETGDVTLSVAGHIFVLTVEGKPADVEQEAPRDLPTSDGSANPFFPVVGVESTATDDDAEEG